VTSAIPDNAATSGILVYRASRLEALLAPLETLLQTAPPASVLAPQTVIAAHPGMKHWLVSALAQRRAPRGIVANLRVLLPSDWLDELAQSLLGAGAIALSPYRSAHLRWRIFEALPDIEDAELANYLQGADSARRRFQLSDRLARLYTQYMVYRPDWLKAWQSGRSAGPASFQAALWRALRLQIGLPHRAERLNELVSHLHQNAAVASSEPLHVFGLSHLAPVELHVLRAIARDRLVVLYVPDPCREYWGGLRGERAQLRALAQQAVDGELQQNLLQLDHPLLANWGRMGQHFVLALNEGEDEVRVDTRHWEDLQTGKTVQPLLAQVQESVRRLHDATVLTAASMLHAQASQDRSLRIHACHTPLRELEVLRDALLMELQQRPDLHPADIVVMAPDIQRYLGLLPAVFGTAGARDAVLPYATADAAVARSHPVFVAFLSLLSLPGARITAPEIVDLLQVPAIARALGLDADGRKQLIAWMQQSRVAWGLDGAFRQQFGVPPIQEHTFSWALDRMLAGHVFGDGERSKGFDEVWPLAGIHGAEVESIGALDRLLLELSALHRDCAQPRPASAWVRRLGHLIDALFESQHGDDAEREAIAALRRMVLSIETETQSAAVDPLLDFSVVRDVLRATLAAAPDRQRLLRGGITFCGMVPQRSIPFRVIAVLGLNEGDYPRQAPDAQLDLMQRQRRLGDRDVRDDDRYLFLETLMAARDLLHLSYIGEGVRDGRARNPAAPLAELLHFLDRSAGIADASFAESAERPWRVRHPLQPFDARYFDDGDPRLFSFRSEFAAMISAAAAASTDWLVAAASVLEAPVTKTLRVEQLLAFYRDPARALCQQQLQLRLDALEDERLMASESLQARTEAIDRIGRRLLFDAFDTGTELPRTAPDWLRLSGLLPAGRLGVLAYAKELDAAQKLLQAAHADALLAPPPSVLPVQIDLALGDRQIRGRLPRVRAHPAQWYVLDAFVGKTLPEIGFRDRLPLFIEWALLRLHCRDQERSIRIVVLAQPVPAKSAPASDDWPRALNDIDDIVAEARHSGDNATLDIIHGDIEKRLIHLLDIRDTASSGRLRYFPRTSWAAAQGGLDEIADKTIKAWCGDDGGFGGERDYAPGYAGWLLRDLDLRTDERALGEVHAQAQALFALINMDAWESPP
jgi:exodeoxyribonuclease V gamma subunit